MPAWSEMLQAGSSGSSTGASPTPPQTGGVATGSTTFSRVILCRQSSPKA